MVNQLLFSRRPTDHLCLVVRRLEMQVLLMSKSEDCLVICDFFLAKRYLQPQRSSWLSGWERRIQADNVAIRKKGKQRVSEISLKERIRSRCRGAASSRHSASGKSGFVYRVT